MRLGLIVRANNRGLGIQSWEFYRHLQPQKTIAVCLVADGDEECTLSRYPEALHIKRYIEKSDFDYFNDCDVVFSFETFYNKREVLRMREEYPNIRFILQPNYEQKNDADVSHGLIVPTVWNFKNWNYGKAYLPVPVDRERLPFKLRTQARVFVHNAGTQLGDDRNGTIALLQAMKYVKNPIKLIVHIQKFSQMMYNEVVKLAEKDERIELDTSTFQNYWELWQKGDVFIYPRTYGGLALPTNEAMSVGIPVVMPNLCPQNEYLPSKLLLPISGVRTIQMHKPIKACTVEPRAIAKKIDELYGMDITNFSKQMDEVARHWSWENMLPKYLEVLEKTIWN